MEQLSGIFLHKGELYLIIVLEMFDVTPVSIKYVSVNFYLTHHHDHVHFVGLEQGTGNKARMEILCAWLYQISCCVWVDPDWNWVGVLCADSNEQKFLLQLLQFYVVEGLLGYIWVDATRENLSHFAHLVKGLLLYEVPIIVGGLLYCSLCGVWCSECKKSEKNDPNLHAQI